MALRGDEIRYDSVELSGERIAYSWCHSRRRTLGITVRPDKSVSVRVPLRTPVKDIVVFVRSRAEWVLKVWARFDSQLPQVKPCYSPSGVFMYLGEPYYLEFINGPRRSLHLHDGLMILTAPEKPSEETVRKMIDIWYRKQALSIMQERATLCHDMMRGEGIPLPPITIRSMKTRWGSYSYRTRRIALNLNLIKMPTVCLNYVIIHELCHIKARHHGPDFWQMVNRYVPDYLDVRRQLRLLSFQIH